MECVMAATAAHLESASPSEITRRFMEHAEQRFRLSYILGTAKSDEDENEEDLEDEDLEPDDEGAEVSAEDERAFAECLHGFLKRIKSMPRLTDGIQDLAF